MKNKRMLTIVLLFVLIITLVEIILLIKRTGLSFTGLPNPLIVHTSQIGRYRLIYPRYWFGGDLPLETSNENNKITHFVALL